MLKQISLILLYLNTSNCYNLDNIEQYTRIAGSCIVIGSAIYYAYDYCSRNTKLASNANTNEKPRITFKDIAGLEQAKKELQDYIDFVKNPAKYKKFGCNFPRGILLTGSPGNGKTYLANAFAGELNCLFYNLSGNDFKSFWYGKTEQNIKALFENCPKDVPVVIFIDEIDAIGSKRLSPDHDMSWTNSTIDELLIQIDRLDKLDTPTFVVAATNHIEFLDDALIRPGRFDKIIKLENPNTEERTAFFEMFNTQLPLSEKFDLEYAVELTAGCSFAKIRSLINQASLIALRRDAEKIEFADFEDAMDVYEVGLKKDFKLSEKQIIELAFHEAGHTLAAVLLDLPLKINKVTINSRGDSLGFTQLSENNNNNWNKKELLNYITMLLCGRIGQEMYSSAIDTGASDDLAKATKLAKQIVCDYGMNDGIIRVVDNYQAKYSENIQWEIELVLKDCYAQGKQLLEDNYDKLEKLAYALVDKKSLSRNEIMDIISN